jgi:hypothetical protein
LCVDVTNCSDSTWTQSALYPLNVGNHWINAHNGEVVVHDDGRGRLPGRLYPGEETRLSFLAQVPTRSGRYRLQLDVVQEGVCWFNDVGSTPFETSVDVVDDDTIDRLTPVPLEETSYTGGMFDDLITAMPFDPPTFDMNGVPRPLVEALLQNHGATLLGTDEWVTEWHSFAYYVQAAG